MFSLRGDPEPEAWVKLNTFVVHHHHHGNKKNSFTIGICSPQIHGLPQNKTIVMFELHTLQHMAIKLAEPAWLLDSFPEERNRKGTESGLYKTAKFSKHFRLK